ncbi:MAG: hypothetical protein UV01_C0009G0060 [Parcubacteria group bacterium GW2011_GWA2_42_14]|nr:MAG: hypothetical protein UV01_C0009G0060 [Parcubacteria group bacterium GW2011_GWA2_42_14]
MMTHYSIKKITEFMKSRKGQILIQVIVFGSIAIYLLSTLVSWASLNIKAGRQAFNRERSLQIAEAGIDYYRWHLAHSPTDFQDGTGGPGPYVHDFRDKDGNIIGQFSLDIIPPPLGSTLATVKSTGSIIGDTALLRKIAVQFAKPSIAKYAVAANAAMRFGSGTEVFGPIHSNGGIRFDALAHNIVTSAVASYDDPDHSGANEFGVHTHVAPTDPLPPSPVPTRTDVFEVGRQFPVPALDFAGITADLAEMKTDAQANGFYRPSAGALGYHIVLRTDDTFDLYRVTSLVNPPSGCTNPGQSGWGTWSIQNQQLVGNYPFPANGIIFLEDDIFVDGQINGGRLTIVAAFLPDNPPFRKNIIVNNDLLYTNYDGSDILGLIAQGNVTVGLVSEDDLRIDAALIAQNGRVGRYYYRPPGGGSQRCSPNHVRQTITLWGMIATNQRYGFAYTDGTGYQIRNLNYDGSLLYGPPPSFPLTSDQYITLTWGEE